MRAWVRDRIPAQGPPSDRLALLLTELLDRPGAPFVYTSGETRSAESAWRSGRANCLSFSHLYVAMAREVGLDVYYLRVHDLATFDREGDLVIASEHVTAAWGPAPKRQLLDFTALPVRDYREVEPISDRTALALHYSNLGAEQILLGNAPRALELSRIAARIDPELSDAWVNLGVARRRTGDFAGAEEAYRRALEVNPEALSAYHNLSTLLAATGREEEGASLATLAEHAGARNPWSYLALGNLSLRMGQLDEAGRLLRRAHRFDPANVEVLAALGQWAMKQGRRGDALRYLKRAERIDAANPRVADLAQRLDDRRPPG